MKHVNESPVMRHHRQVAALQQQLFCIELVQSCTDLIDELQRERGLSLLALSPQAESYAAALREQVGLSREAEQVLRQRFSELSAPQCAGFPGAHKLVRAGLAVLNSPGLADLSGMRQRVLLIHCSREQAFSAYSGLLAQLLGLVGVVREVLHDAELERELGTLEQLMLAKEYSGQERGCGSGLLASGRHDAQAWQHTLALIEAQHRCAAQFISQARPSARRRLKETLSAETQDELEVLRQRLAGSVDGAQLDPALCEVWFCTCSRRMNELREVERGLLQEMREAMQLKLEQHAVPGALAMGTASGRLTGAAVETILRTAASWLAGEGSGALLKRGPTAA